LTAAAFLSAANSPDSATDEQASVQVPGEASIKTIVIVGATGFLGSALARRFCGLGYRVAAMGRGDGRSPRLEGIRDQIEWFTIDRDGVDAPFTRLGQVDAVLFAAANFGREGEGLDHVFEVNTALPLRVLNASILGGCPLFVNADTALHNIINAYSLSKHHFAEWGRFLSQRHQLRFLDVRLEHIYGPGDDERKFPAFVIRTLLRNEPTLPLTPGEQRRDFVFIDDVADAYQVLVQSSGTLALGYHEFSVGSGHSATIREFVSIAKEMTASQTRLEFGALGYRPHEVMQSEAELAAMQALGWTARTSLEEGLRSTIDMEKQRCAY